jgi:type IV pilus assembly protein PilC
MRYSLSSGMMLRDTMDMLATRGLRVVRPVAAKMVKDLKAGWSLQDALKKQEDAFPPLFIALVRVGEESGNLPEVLGELERFFVLQQKLRREFVSQISFPVMQFIASIGIVALLIYILGILAVSRGPSAEVPLDPLGLGLTGERGALIFLGSAASIVLGAIALFLLAKRLLRRRAIVERLLLRVPGIGPCLRALAMTRFCVACRLMLETSLSVFRTIRLAFLATDNGAFIAAAPRVEAALRQGNSVTQSLAGAGVFKEKFLASLTIAEESGRMPESLRYQAEEYDEETRRRLGFLTRVAGSLVWLGVAGVIITCIVRIFVTVYLGNIEKYMPR